MLQNVNNFHINQTDVHELLSRPMFLPKFFSFQLITEFPGWHLKQTDLSEVLHEQADSYRAQTDSYDTIVSFCVVNSEHCQISKMEIFAKIINRYFHKKLHLRLVRVLNTPLLSLQIIIRSSKTSSESPR